MMRPTCRQGVKRPSRPNEPAVHRISRDRLFHRIIMDIKFERLSNGLKDAQV